MDIQKLRNIVLVGMEENKWTNQNVLNKNSIDFFKFIYPRTYSTAIFNLAKHITSIEHEKNIHGNKYHLFSLPYNIERNLVIEQVSINNINYIEELENIAGAIAIEGKPGPVLVGNIAELASNEIYQIIAKHYLVAFKSGYKTFPYLS